MSTPGTYAVTDIMLSVTQTLSMTFASPGSHFSLISLLCALIVAILFIRKRRPVGISTLARIILPTRIWRSRSGRADIGLFLFNILIAGALFGWAIFSAGQVSAVLSGYLQSWFGQASPAHLPVSATGLLMTMALFLAYELAYWVDHYLNHQIPWLWHFHKVHHTAESLSPLTNYRVHPVDTIIFLNVVALFVGGTHALAQYALGIDAPIWSLNGTNLFLVVFIFCLLHLQHSQFWIAFTGIWGRLILSPAHHQLHHSSDPRHFNRNYGNGLAIWDWLFGTLYVPGKAREHLVFGVREAGRDFHSARGVMLAPFADMIRSTLPASQSEAGPPAAWPAHGAPPA
jgi:sterol desaturase/sphingolipid hydroxylase (fatty acid hydroxylase superfamily)